MASNDTPSRRSKPGKMFTFLSGKAQVQSGVYWTSSGKRVFGDEKAHFFYSQSSSSRAKRCLIAWGALNLRVYKKKIEAELCLKSSFTSYIEALSEIYTTYILLQPQLFSVLPLHLVLSLFSGECVRHNTLLSVACRRVHRELCEL